MRTSAREEQPACHEDVDPKWFVDSVLRGMAQTSWRQPGVPLSHSRGEKRGCDTPSSAVSGVSRTRHGPLRAAVIEIE